MTQTGDRQRQERDSATRRLLVAYQSDGDTRARDRLVQLYLPLVETLARRYRGPRAEYEDLCQAGSIGLLNAIERFDADRGGEFAAFAVPTVAGEMKRYIRDRTGTVRLPRRLQEAAAGLPAKREELSRRLGRTPSHEELAEALGIDPVDISSIEQPVLADLDPDERPDADPGLAGADERLLLAGAFETLEEEEREIIFLRFVEDVDRKDVAKRLGISESQLGRRSRRALEKLRRELEEGALAKAAESLEESPPQPDPEPEPGAAPAASPTPAKASGSSGHSGRLLLRMPQALHDDLADAAEREGVSLNRFITSTLTAVVERGDDAPEAAAARKDLDVREVPRWLPAAIVVNIVIVALAAIVAMVLLAVALTNGW